MGSLPLLALLCLAPKPVASAAGLEGAAERIERLLEEKPAGAWAETGLAQTQEGQDRARRVAEALKVLAPSYLETLRLARGMDKTASGWELAELAAPDRAKALRVLADEGAKEHAALAARFLRERSPDLRFEALSALTRLGGAGSDADASARLMPLADDPDPRVALLAIRALKDALPRERHLSFVARIVDEGSTMTRLDFLQMTKAMKYEKRPGAFLVSLLELLAEAPTPREAMAASRWVSHQDAAVRLAAVRVLTGARSKSWGMRAAFLLGDEDPRVARAARDCMQACALRGPELAAVLRKSSVEASIFEHRLWALKGLERLEGAARDPARDARLLAARADSARKAALYLVAKSSADGSWPSATHLDIRHDVWVAVTALASLGLEATLRPANGRAAAFTPEESARAAAAAGRAQDYLAAQASKTEGTGWCGLRPLRLAFTLSALARGRLPDDRKRAAIAKTMSHVYHEVKRDGGFGYGMPGDSVGRGFVTGAVMIGLLDVVEAGGEGAERARALLPRAAASLESGRSGDVISYSSRPEAAGFANSRAAAAGRTVLAELALLRWRKISGQSADTAALDRALSAYRESRPFLEKIVRASRAKLWPHDAPQEISDYFYLYGLYFVAQALRVSSLPDKTAFSEELAASLIDMQEGDRWTDSSFTGPTASTAMALAILAALP